MNELFDKLIEQCTTQNFSDCTGAFETFDKEKFAELIVGECLNIIDDERRPEMVSRIELWKQIKEHFGVR